MPDRAVEGTEVAPEPLSPQHVALPAAEREQAM